VVVKPVRCYADFFNFSTVSLVIVYLGICGRTGSGKSSLLLALLRLNVITEGDILLDGKSLLTMSLESARSEVAIIPQDPHLFSGTVRYTQHSANYSSYRHGFTLDLQV
jgi:ABC-type transport system involved in cytochrome bd biosynthesis fused ATPase/permease subunit